MRADRLLSILLLLQTHPRLSAHELARRMEVSARTILRDMEALGAAGVPVVADRGARGGWRLLEGYRTNLTGLNAAEIQALFVARPSRMLADLGLERAADAALIKLLAALPTLSRQGAEYTRQRLHIDGAGWRQTTDAVPYLLPLQEAIWQERRVRFTYQRADGVCVERLIDPLGLVAKGSLWYLVAAVAGELRTYRVSRVQSVVLTDDLCVRPPNFDLAAFWEQSAAEFKANLPRYPVLLRVVPQALDRLRYAGNYSHVERVEEATPDDPTGWLRVQMRFEEAHNASELLVGFGGQVEVIDPPELRAMIIQAAHEALALYTA